MRLSEIAKTKASDELRLAIQSGQLDKKQAFSLRKIVRALIEKYAKGDDWEIKQQFLDTGLYYNGTDGAEARRVGKDVLGALYGLFQDGARRTVTPTVPSEDENFLTYTVTPMAGADSQIRFVLHKKLTQGGPVIGVNVTVPF